MSFKKHLASGSALFNKGKNFILDLLFPIECLGCGKHGGWLCRECFRKLKFNHSQYCLVCKKENKFGEFCNSCSSGYYMDGIWIAGNYDDAILGKLIKNLKYRFAKNIAQTLGKFLAIFIRNLINKAKINKSDLTEGVHWRKFEKIKQSPKILFNLKDTLLIPVPLHKKRLNWRGFNQAQMIADCLAENFNLVTNNQLIRHKHKKAQAKLKETERKINIQGCFEWQGDNLNNYRIILIDDVVTTGSTLNECAKVLKKAGAKEIWGLVVAKG